MTKQQRGWGIVNRSNALYFGWSITRCCAIAQHVHDRSKVGEPQPSQLAYDGLDELQKRAWERCRRNGDRAVKVTISWSKP